MSRVDPLAVLDSQIAELRASGDTGNVESLVWAREVFAGAIVALKIAVRQNANDMLMTGEELRTCEDALARCGSQP